MSSPITVLTLVMQRRNKNIKNTASDIDIDNVAFQLKQTKCYSIIAPITKHLRARLSQHGAHIHLLHSIGLGRRVA